MEGRPWRGRPPAGVVTGLAGAGDGEDGEDDGVGGGVSSATVEGVVGKGSGGVVGEGNGGVEAGEGGSPTCGRGDEIGTADIAGVTGIGGGRLTDLDSQSMMGFRRSSQGIPRIIARFPIGTTRNVSSWVVF